MVIIKYIIYNNEYRKITLSYWIWLDFSKL